MKKSIKSYLSTIGIHFAIFFIVYVTFSFLGLIKGFPSIGSLSQWDVGWYQSIKDNGYSFNPDKQSNVAFFPLFPLLWKITHLSTMGISIVNLIFLYAGVFLLFKTYNLDRKNTLLLLSVPSLFFCYVPYSEAVFFLAGSLIIYGLKNNKWLAILGVFIACSTRSASLIFIPVIIFSKLYNLKKGADNRKIINETLLLILSAVLSTLLAQYVQYLDTGEFFTIFKAQEMWNRKINIPALYFTTWDEARLIWLDGLALLVGLAAMFLCCVFLLRKYNHPKKTISSNYLFSIVYLALVSFVTVLYSGEDALGGTSLYSLNRFVFSTPFFMVFLIMLIKKNRVEKSHMIVFLVISIITWLSFNATGSLRNLDKFEIPHSKTQMYFGIVFLYSLLFMLISNKRYRDTLWSGVYLFNVILQIYLFSSFLRGTWIG